MKEGSKEEQKEGRRKGDMEKGRNICERERERERETETERERGSVRPISFFFQLFICSRRCTHLRIEIKKWKNSNLKIRSSYSSLLNSIMSLETYAAIKMDFVIESEKEILLEKGKVLSKSLS